MKIRGLMKRSSGQCAGHRAVRKETHHVQYSVLSHFVRVFLWSDKVSNESIFAMWHARGYGGYSVDEAVLVPGLAHALVTDWNGDNAGPFDAKTYIVRYCISSA